MEVLNDAQRILIAQIISNPNMFAVYRPEMNLQRPVTRTSEASQPIFPVPQGPTAQAELISSSWLTSTSCLPVNVDTQQPTPAPGLEAQRPGTITPTHSELVDSPPNRQMLRHGSQTPDFGGFKPYHVTNLVTSFTPLFDTDEHRTLKTKQLAPSEYEEIGMHLLQCFGEMVQEQKVHFMPLLGGLLAAAITTLDAESLQYNKASHDGHEANKVAKLVAVRTSASLCVRPHLWQPPDHLDPILIKGVTDTAKRTQLYLELNALAMNRITPLLTERALAFSHRANVRPIPLSKNERSFFFQLMTVFPLHGNEKELNERIAQWVAALPIGLKRLRCGQENLLKQPGSMSGAALTTKPVIDLALASPDKRARLVEDSAAEDLSCFDNLSLASLRKLLTTIGNITGSGKCLPWTAVCALAPCDTMLPDDTAHACVDTLRSTLNKLGLNEDTKDSPGLWKIWAEFMLTLGVKTPWPSMMKKQLTWFCRVLVLKKMGRDILKNP